MAVTRRPRVLRRSPVEDAAGGRNAHQERLDALFPGCLRTDDSLPNAGDDSTGDEDVLHAGGKLERRRTR